MRSCLGLLASMVIAGTLVGQAAAETPKRPGLFARDNLVAWCVVPFDAQKRGPKERAEMLKRLGFTKLAYDWRQEHVPTFEEEILALKKAGIELFAFWSEHEAMFRLFEKHAVTAQVWRTVPSPQRASQEEMVAVAAKQLLPLVERTRGLGCKVGLYNHGGWGGEPGNMIAVCQWMRKHAGADHVGIVYNLHHGHEHLDTFPESFRRMVPHLLCVNLNGMTRGGPKIMPLGEGEEDLEILRMIRDSGYRGPIGLLDHRNDLDAEQSLRQNLEGLKKLLRRMGDAKALKTYAD